MDRKFPGDLGIFGLTCFTLTLVVGANVLGEVMFNACISAETIVASTREMKQLILSLFW